MKIVSLFCLMVLFTTESYSQFFKFAIINFDNLSGNVKFDGLGKARSNMLISALTNNKIYWDNF